MSLDNWSFFLKFMAAPIAATIFFIMIVLQGVSGISELNEDLDTIVADKFTISTALSGKAATFRDLNGRLFQALTFQAAGDLEAGSEEKLLQVKEEMEQLSADLEKLTQGLSTGAMKNELTRVVAAINQFAEAVEVVSSMMEIDFGAAAGQVKPLNDNYIEVLSLMDAQVAASLRDARALTAEARESGASARNLMITVAIVALGIMIFFALYISRSTTASVRRIAEATEILAGGNVDIRFKDLERKDELGVIITSLHTFRDGLRENIRMREEQEKVRAEREAEAGRRQQEEEDARLREQEREKEQQKQAEQDRQKLIDNLLNGFDCSVVNEIRTLGTIVGDVKGEAEGMKSRLDSSIERADELASTSASVSGNMQTVAAATEEMASSVQEIARQVSEASMVSQMAVQNTEESSETIGELADAAAQIGEVVKLINDIAEQTNLLALNATIEAARAGDAGKGFAVVASEVKSLAAQTAQATEGIRVQVEGIQGKTDHAVGAMRKIADVIQKVDGISSSIASAIEEQGAATQEINRTVTEAKSGIDHLASNAQTVAESTKQNCVSALSVLESTGKMGSGFVELEGSSVKFSEDVKTL